MQRQAITVRGVVQGVGFRPFVHRLATRLQLDGFVQNLGGTVRIEVEGETPALDRFRQALSSQPPPLARIDALSLEPLPPRGEPGFRIADSATATGDRAVESPIFISPDMATCADCLAELFDPWNRRYRYPFINCTNCGPRLSIIEAAPYDRARTTMRVFAMCSACQAEYVDPSNRRFHAEPTACSACGPQLSVVRPDGTVIAGDDPLEAFVEIIRQGQLGALQGLGGFHLVCDATCEPAVQTLRRRKERDAKPFALMLRDVAAVRQFCLVDAAEQSLLESPQRPIVLLRRRPSSVAAADAPIAASVAPGNPFLGVMLPYTPLHHLLLAAVDGLPLVMTSGNRADEPIAHRNDDALARLASIADGFLMHDRPIHVRADDSVVQVIDGVAMPLRRARGYAPAPLQLPFACPVPLLAVGGQYKGVFALGRENQAFLSQHLGDLEHYAAYAAFERDLALYEELFEIEPQALVHDLHPDYASTIYAERRAAAEGRPRIAVQHHHAHLASGLAEHGLDEPAIGVCFDGTGYGTDGAIWGGEFLVGDYAHFARALHLRYVRMPGVAQAIREPWRMGLAHLLDAGCEIDSLSGVQESDWRPPDARHIGCEPEAGAWGRASAAKSRPQRVSQRQPSPGDQQRSNARGRTPLGDPLGAKLRCASSTPGALPMSDVSPNQLQIAAQMIHRQFQSPETSSMGRWFDAVAAISGVRSFVQYEGQAAQELEWLATDGVDDGAYPFALTPADHGPAQFDTRPATRAIAADVDQGAGPANIARRFHTTVVNIIAAGCQQIRQQSGLTTVILTGGVFLNRLITREAVARLSAEGFRVYRHERVPPGDGGLCLGQLAIAARTLTEGGSGSEIEIPWRPADRQTMSILLGR